MIFDEWYKHRFGHGFAGVSDEDCDLEDCWKVAEASLRDEVKMLEGRNKLDEATCHRGHTTVKALWDCPVCVQKEREQADAEVRRLRDEVKMLRSALEKDEHEGCDVYSEKYLRDFDDRW